MSKLPRFAGFLVLISMVHGCGGGGSSGASSGVAPAPTPTPTVSAGGIWYGDARWGIDWNDYVGMVTETGRAYFASEQGSWVTSVQVATSGNTVTGGTFSPTNHVISVLNGDPAFLDAPGGSPMLNGTAISRSTLNVQAAFPGTNTLVMELGYERGRYEQPSSLGTVAGNYAAWWDLLDEQATLNVNSDGTLFLQAPQSGCVVNGQISIINASYNLYDISYSFSSCAAQVYLPLNGVTFTGLARLVPNRYDASDPNLYLKALVTGPVAGTSAGDDPEFRRN